jgi:hypothetical protein
MPKILTATAEVVADVAKDVVTEMPFSEVLIKSVLAYVSIFLVTSVIIGAVWLLGKATNKK